MDSVPGGKTYRLALAHRFARPPRIKRTETGLWECDGAAPVVGIGATPQEAYVDHVEEAWCFAGYFPPGYPN